MTDFFTRLAEQTLGLAPTARPLLPSRFAAGPALAGTFNSAMDEAPVVEDGGAVEITSRLDTMPMLFARSPQAASDLLRGRSAVPSQNAIGQKHTEILPSSSPLIPSEALSFYRSQTENTEPQLRPREVSSPTVQERTQLRVADPGRRDVDNESSLPGRRSTPVSEIHYQESPPLQSQARFASFSQDTSAHEALPDIQVTIGRIDVRAMLPPTPPAASSTPNRPRPALSLDDYLKQQKGGKR